MSSTNTGVNPRRIVRSAVRCVPRRGGRRLPSVAIDSYALMISNGLNAVLGLVYWVVAARLYPVEEVGRATTLVNVGVVLSSASILACGQMMERFLPVCGRLRARVIALVSVLVAALAVVWSGAFVLLWSTPGLFTQAWQRPTYVCAVVVLALFALYDSVLVGLNMGRWAAVKNVLHAVVKLAAVLMLALVFVDASGAGVNAAMIVATWVIPAGILVVIAQCALAVRHRAVGERAAAVEPSLPPTRQLVGYFFTSVGWMVGQVLPGLFLPLLVVHTLGVDNAAYFNLAWIVVAASIMLMSVLSGPFVAEASRPGADVAAATRSLVRLVAGVSVLRCVGVAVLGPVALFLYGQDYARQGWLLLVLMGCAHCISGPAFVYGALAKVYRRITYPMTVQLVGSVLLVALVWWWLPRYGIAAVGWAYVAHDVGVLLAAWVPLRRLLALALGDEK